MQDFLIEGLGLFSPRSHNLPRFKPLSTERKENMENDGKKMEKWKIMNVLEATWDAGFLDGGIGSLLPSLSQSPKI